MAIHYQSQNSNQFHNSWKHCMSCFSSAKLTPLHEKIRIVFTCQGTLVAWDGDHGEKGHVPKYKVPRKSSLVFSWRLLFKGQFSKREDVPFFPRNRPTCLRWMSLRFIRMQITKRFKPVSLDFGFAYGDRSFSCKAIVISFSKSHIKLSLRSSQVKRTPKIYINEFIKNLIRKLNPSVVVDVRLISAFLHA